MLARTLRATLLSGLAALAFTSSMAAADTQTQKFNKPTINKYRLDWCKSWGKNCGKAAADAFCKLHEFSEAKSFMKDEHPGVPTKVFSGGQICDDNTCASFTYINCQKTVTALDNSDEDIAQQGGDGEPAQNPKGGNAVENGSEDADGDDPAPYNATVSKNLGGEVQGELSAVTFKDNGQPRVAVFAKGKDGKLWWQAGDGNGQWYGWEAVGSKIMSYSPSCANSSHGVTCNYIGAGNYIWSITYTGGKWTMHEKTDGQSKASPAAASYKDEEGKSNIIVFVKDGLGRLVANWKNKDPETDFWKWQGWTPTNGKISGTPACRQAGPTSVTIFCAAKASDGSTVVHKLEGASYKSAKNLGGSTTSRPQIVAGSVTPGVRVLVRGDDSRIWWSENLLGIWTEWKPTTIKTSKGPACALQPGAATDWCFDIGPAGNVIATGFKDGAMFK